MDDFKFILILMVSGILVLFSGCIIEEEEGYVNGTIEIKGSALASNLSSYKVEIGEGSNTSNWSTVGIELTGEGTSKIANGTLASWDTTRVKDGEYTIRLTVTDTRNQSSEDLVYVTVDNIFISSPENGSAISNNDVIEITGKVIGANFDHYALEYAYKGNSTYWSSEGIILENDGQEQVDQALLASWNTSSTNKTGEYLLRLNVYGSDSLINYEDVVVVLENYQPGWPQSTNGSIYSSPAVGDLDNDNDFEVVVGSYDGKVYAWHDDGSLVEGWPKNATDAYTYIESSPALADLDNDDDLEVVIGSYDGEVYAWHHDGSLVEGWPQETTTGYYSYIESSPALGDLDNDGDLEVVIGSYEGYEGRVYAWHDDGSLVEGWPQETDYVVSSPALGDLDGDGKLEIVVGSYDGKVYAWHDDGSLVEGWPQETTSDYYSYIESSPALADLDNDSDLEIIAIVDSYYSLKIYAWHDDGSLVEGWPQEIDEYYYDSSPAVGDLDLNGEPEIVIGASMGIYVYQKNGSLLDEWPQSTEGAITSSPALADLDNDSDLEIIVGSNDGKVYAWHHDGSLVDGWPKNTVSEYVDSSPAVADLDGDGDIEVIIGSYDGKVHVWDEAGECDPYQIEWGKFRYNLFNTGWYGGDVINVTNVTSTTTTTTTTTTLLGEVPGDTDGDGDVNDLEILTYIGQWVEGLVDDLNLLAAIEYWAT